MARSFRAAALRLSGVALAATLALSSGCDNGTAFMVEVDLEPGTRAPDFLLVTWFDSTRLMGRDEPVPATGALDPNKRPVATVQIDVEDPDRDANRRILIRGVIGNSVVSRAITRASAVPGRWVRIPVVLSTALPEDRDADGVPDDIDACPGNDFSGC